MGRLDDRHREFAALHEKGCFVIPNPWDAGSARIMAAYGAKALATTSSGFAFTLGRPDMGNVTRDEALAHAQDIVAATSLPVSGDFENGFGDSPDYVGETVRLAREAGLSGCSIEDTQMRPGNEPYQFDQAVERIRAAADAARSLKAPFVLCARADGMLTGHYGLEEAISRLKAFAEAGADLVYAPLVSSLEDLSAIARSVNKPINALAAGQLARHSVQEIAAAGARRISIGGMAARVAQAAIRDSMRGVLLDGNFKSFSGAAPGAEIDQLLKKGGWAADEN